MKYLTLILITLLPAFAFSQDLIVTAKGDSLNCKITKERDDFIYFTFKYDEEIRNTLLPHSEIKVFAYDFWEAPELLESDVKKQPGYQVLRFALNAGYGHRTAPLPDNIPGNLTSYYKDLKSGFAVEGHISGFTSEFLGFGLKYNWYTSSASSDQYGEEKVSISFIGPSVSTRFLSRDKNSAFVSSLIMGRMGYADKMYNGHTRLEGSTFGMGWDLGYDFNIAKNVALGFQLSLLAGTLTKVSLTNGMTTTEIDLEDDEMEGLGRIDFSVGVRF
ncbi:hypothetical protein [uncultured Draconibacterium sp.]|uniref:hypothetical protein n=1 Tax=uncultured Draconibacterium sp. TaxID=1573823 RepID=UPI0029C61E5C|nr:hypothetical protein [uncultured Draconibacterium sp.]